MPQLPVDRMRQQVRDAIDKMTGDLKIIVFGCEHGINVDRLKSDDTLGVKLICSGMLPPTLVEYALKQGADGVMVTGCRQNDCYFRFGNRWTRLRFAGDRKPSLRARAERERILIHGGAEPDAPKIERDLAAFRERLREINQAAAVEEQGA